MDTSKLPLEVKLTTLDFAILRGITQAVICHSERLKAESSATRQSFGEDFVKVAQFLDEAVADPNAKDGFLLVSNKAFTDMAELLDKALMEGKTALEMMTQAKDELYKDYQDTVNILDEISTRLGTGILPYLPADRELILTRVNNLLALEIAQRIRPVKALKPAPKSTPKKSAKRRK